MKATHKHKDGPYDRVYSLESDGTIWVKLDGLPWKISAWTGSKRFHDVTVRINTFKGNK